MPDEYGDFRDVQARIREAKARDDRGAELKGLLLWCLAQTEDEAEQTALGVAPSYYYELAVLYRKRRDCAAEVRVLESYAAQSKAPGVMPAKLAERLARARALAGLPAPPEHSPPDSAEQPAASSQPGTGPHAGPTNCHRPAAARPATSASGSPKASCAVQTASAGEGCTCSRLDPRQGRRRRRGGARRLLASRPVRRGQHARAKQRRGEQHRRAGRGGDVLRGRPR